MKRLCATVSAVVSLALPALVHAQDRAARQASPEATTDPLKLIYRVPGIRDNGGGANSGTATAFHCTNYSAATENLRIRVFDNFAAPIADKTFPLLRNQTFTATTHATNVFTEDDILSPGKNINQGQAAIFATSPKMACTAMIVDAAAPGPAGIALHMVRFNPQQGTVE